LQGKRRRDPSLNEKWSDTLSLEAFPENKVQLIDIKIFLAAQKIGNWLRACKTGASQNRFKQLFNIFFTRIVRKQVKCLNPYAE
jgi:hypothetical protein